MTFFCSPFAQSGVGVYDVLPMDSKIIVVHDMERMSPLAFDTVCLWTLEMFSEDSVFVASEKMCSHFLRKEMR